MKQFIAILCLLWAPLIFAETQVMQGVDDGTYHVELGHSFPYYGGVFTDAWMSSNGFIILYDPTTGYGNSNTSQSWCNTCPWYYSGGPPQGRSNLSYMIAPLWSDFRHDTSISNSGFFYETGEGGTWFEWRNVIEYATNNRNTFGLQLWPEGSFDFHYAEVNVTRHDTWIGFTGDTTSKTGDTYDEVNELFYKQNSMSTSDVTDFTDAETNFGYAWWGQDGGYSSGPDCSDPLNDTSCPGYEEAYFNQQCTADPLYDTQCSGYEQAYLDQQCGIDPLYSTQCPGYEQAYQDQQCAINPLFNNQCPGYAEAYFNQQCGLDALYDPQCPGYAEAYFNQQCGLDPLYDNQCPGYGEAWLDAECEKDPQFSPSCKGYKFEEVTPVSDGSDKFDDGTKFDDGMDDGKDDGSMSSGYEEPKPSTSGGMDDFSEMGVTTSDGTQKEEKLDEPITEQPVYAEEKVEEEEKTLFEKVASEEIKQEEVFEEPVFQEQINEPDLEAEFEREVQRPTQEKTEPETIQEYEKVEEEFFAEETLITKTPEERVVKVVEPPKEQVVEKPAPVAKPEKRIEATPKEVALAINIAKDTVRGLLELNTPLTSEERLALDVASAEPPVVETEENAQEIQVVETQQAQQTQQENQEQVEEDFGDNSSDQTIDQTFGEQMTQSFAAGGNIGTFLSGQQPDYSRFDVQPPSVDVQVDIAKAESAVQEMSQTEIAQSASNLTQQIQSGGGFDQDQSLAVTVIGYNPEIQAYDNVTLPDRDQFYRSKSVYKGNENKDNMGLMYRMMGRGDRLHSEMVQQQYEER